MPKRNVNSLHSFMTLGLTDRLDLFDAFLVFVFILAKYLQRRVSWRLDFMLAMHLSCE